MLITLTIIRIEKNAAILKTSDNNTVIWPINKLPQDVKIGSVLFFNISENSIDASDNQILAKKILNEILNC